MDSKNGLHSKREKFKYQLFNVIAYILLSTILSIQKSNWKICFVAQWRFYSTNLQLLISLPGSILQENLDGMHNYKVFLVHKNILILRYFLFSLNFFSVFHFLTDYNAESNVYRLIPFYLTFTAFVPLHAKFAITIYRIALRYRCLNNIIRSFTLVGSINFGLNFDHLVFKIYTLQYHFAVNKHGYFQPDFNEAECIIRRFMEIYDSLGRVLQYEARYFFSKKIDIFIWYWLNYAYLFFSLF